MFKAAQGMPRSQLTKIPRLYSETIIMQTNIRSLLMISSGRNTIRDVLLALPVLDAKTCDQMRGHYTRRTESMRLNRGDRQQLNKRN